MHHTPIICMSHALLTAALCAVRDCVCCRKFNYKNSELLCYEASEVQRCLHEGKKESAFMTQAETLTIMKTLDEVRRQVGVVYPEEKEQKGQ